MSEQGKANLKIAQEKYCREHPGCHAGENNPSFGRTGEDSPVYQEIQHSTGIHSSCTEKLKEEVREADHQQCQLCGMTGEEHSRRYNRNLNTHHIYGNIDRDQPCESTKLITLCQGCHKKVQPYFEHYIPQFEEIVRRR